MKPSDHRKWLGQRIKDAREIRGWKQIALAKATGIPQSTLSEIEKGSDPLDAEDIIAIAIATNMPLSFFDPNRKPNELAGVLRDIYPDMDAGTIRSIVKIAEALYQEDLRYMREKDRQ